VVADALTVFCQTHSNRLFRWFSYMACVMGLPFLIYAKLVAVKVFLLGYLAVLLLGQRRRAHQARRHPSIRRLRLAHRRAQERRALEWARAMRPVAGRRVLSARAWIGIWELYQGKMATRELLWQHRNQLGHFSRATVELPQAGDRGRRVSILAGLGRDSLMESYLWTIHRYHREHEPPAAG
jgi:hypothetical protein